MARLYRPRPENARPEASLSGGPESYHSSEAQSLDRFQGSIGARHRNAGLGSNRSFAEPSIESIESMLKKFVLVMSKFLPLAC
jgi:hypothetical protein